jgi:hypothetical protein
MPTVAGIALAGLIAGHLLLAQQPAPRRQLQGIVIDSVTSEPVTDVRVGLFERQASGARVLKLQTMTDSAGRFRIGVAAPRLPALELRRIGFAPVDVLLDAASWEDTLVVALARTATRLDEVRVVERQSFSQRRLAASGFADRKKVGIGKFLDSATVARSGATSLVALLRPYFKGCTMIFVDGGPGRLGDVDISTVIGVEIYASNTEAPPNFRNRAEGGGRCGSIAVWR